MNRSLLLLPFITFAVIVGWLVLGNGLDQTTQPSKMIGKAVPEFALIDLPGMGPALTSDDLQGQVSLVNVFGSWCPQCHVEHPFLMELKEQDLVSIFGINWMDKPERGAAWLEEHGNPYARVGNDETSRTIFNFGVTGAPETFLVDAKGVVRYRLQGPLTRHTWEKTLLPMIEEIRAEQGIGS